MGIAREGDVLAHSRPDSDREGATPPVEQGTAASAVEDVMESEIRILVQTNRIAVHQKPDLDALVAVWLAQRHLSIGESAEVVFFPEGHPLYKEVGIAWCAEAGRVGALDFGLGRKRQSFSERYSASATGQVWAYLLNVGKPVNHLIDLVDAVHAGATGQASAGRPWNNLDSTLRKFWHEANAASLPDIALYHAARAWLDEYDKNLRKYSNTPPDWEQVAARLPKEKGTYALILSSRASRAFLVGRTGNLGRMVTQPGFYVYFGSASSGLRGRDKHHLTPVERLKAKWQVDSLRLVCSLEEIWYTASSHRWECPWVECMLTLPGAQIPEPKRFGASGCEGKCVTHLPFFAEQPSLEMFRSVVGKLSPSGCRVERLVVRQGN